MYAVIWFWFKGNETNSDHSIHYSYKEALDKFRNLCAAFEYVEIVDMDKSTPDGEPYPVKCFERIECKLSQ